MNPKAIVYSAHAAGRLKERRITRQQVRWLLSSGIRETAPEQGRRFTYDGNVWQVRGYLGKREAAAIFVEDAHRILIITVEWIE